MAERGREEFTLHVSRFTPPAPRSKNNYTGFFGRRE
jgi:hypothetical protein